MNRMTIKGLCILMILASLTSLFCACKSGANPQKASSNQPNEQEDRATYKGGIPFIVAKRYFVKNTIESIQSPRIETQDEFDKIFGVAAVMA